MKIDDLAKEVTINLNKCSNLINARIEEKFTNESYETVEELESVIEDLKLAQNVFET